MNETSCGQKVGGVCSIDNKHCNRKMRVMEVPVSYGCRNEDRAIKNGMKGIGRLSDHHHMLKSKISNNSSMNMIRRTITSFMRSRSFSFNGQDFNYNDHIYNHSWRNERSVEIPIIKTMIENCHGRILEVGNVLSHYNPINHDVLDKYEKGYRVINEDAAYFKCTEPYDNIISISTIEHIGQDEDVKEPKKPLRAIINLLSLLHDKGVMVITIPVGYNHTLDMMISWGAIPFSEIHCLKRVSFLNEWKEASFEEVKDARFNYPYNNANGLMILTFRSTEMTQESGIVGSADQVQKTVDGGKE